MLLNDFFTIQTERKQGDDSTELDLSLNPEHDIFNGHFPKQPVVPGVCMIQMVTETVNHLLSRKMYLFESAVTKFLNVLDPNIHPDITLKILWKNIEEKEVNIDAQLFFEQTVFFKFKGKFQ